jgi:hypothetical protein
MTVFANLVKVATATTGTGTLTIGSAAAGYQTPAQAGVPDGSVIRYLIREGVGFEIGYGTYNAPYLTRTLMESSTGSLLDLQGTATVSIVPAAEDIVNKAGDTMTGDLTVPNLITSGNVDGRDVSADGTKLDGIEAGATADQTGAEIKALYEAEADTNAFTDAEQTKLAGIETGADVTDATNVAAAGALMATGGETTGPIWRTHGTNHRVIVGTPNSGVYYGSSNRTGAIEIKMPAGLIQAWVMMTVDIGQLTTNAHSVLRISGYIWQAPGGTTWSSVSVTNETGDPVRDLTVRFGDDGTTHVLWIGELAAAWYYPTVVVRDVTFTEPSFDPAVDYANGWTVGLQATAFGTVGITDTENLPFAKGLSYGGSTKLVAATGGATLTGNLATTSVSFGSTALDAYEEGTFAPVYSDGTNNAVAYTTQAGFYTLTGDICKFNIRIAPNNIGSVSGSLQINGLPFAAKNTSNYYSGIAVHWANNLAITAGQAVTGYIQLNQSVIYMHLWDATTGTTALTSTEWPVNGAIILSGEYKIS